MSRIQDVKEKPNQEINIDESMSNLKMLMLTLSSSVITPGCGTHSIDPQNSFNKCSFNGKYDDHQWVMMSRNGDLTKIGHDGVETNPIHQGFASAVFHTRHYLVVADSDLAITCVFFRKQLQETSHFPWWKVWLSVFRITWRIEFTAPGQFPVTRHSFWRAWKGWWRWPWVLSTESHFWFGKCLILLDVVKFREHLYEKLWNGTSHMSIVLHYFKGNIYEHHTIPRWIPDGNYGWNFSAPELGADLPAAESSLMPKVLGGQVASGILVEIWRTVTRKTMGKPWENHDVSGRKPCKSMLSCEMSLHNWPNHLWFPLLQGETSLGTTWVVWPKTRDRHSNLLYIYIVMWKTQCHKPS